MTSAEFFRSEIPLYLDAAKMSVVAGSLEYAWSDQEFRRDPGPWTFGSKDSEPILTDVMKKPNRCENAVTPIVGPVITIDAASSTSAAKSANQAESPRPRSV